MYNQKMVCCLKANGKVLREFNDTVYVPFGTEYKILLKNLNSVKALVNITIDGNDVVPGGLVIDANREVELERFVKDMNKGNRFKFIERTAGIEQHRGIKVDDGLIRISFNFEKQYPKFEPPRVMGGSWGGQYDRDYWMGKLGHGYNTNAISTNSALRSMTHDSTISGSTLCSAQYSAAAAEPQLMNMATAQSLAGITAPGSVSDQKFHQASWFATEAETHVMVLRLLGETDLGKQVTAPVTVKTVPVCTMCGRKNRSGAKFCTDCGSGLDLI
jgi:hypothetical protein